MLVHFKIYNTIDDLNDLSYTVDGVSENISTLSDTLDNVSRVANYAYSNELKLSKTVTNLSQTVDTTKGNLQTLSELVNSYNLSYSASFQIDVNQISSLNSCL